MSVPELNNWTVKPAEGDTASGTIGKGYWLTDGGNRNFHISLRAHAEDLCTILNGLEERLYANWETAMGEDL